MIYKQFRGLDGTLSPDISCINPDGSISYIPNAIENRDWQEYQLWLAQGNTPDPA